MLMYFILYSLKFQNQQFRKSPVAVNLRFRIPSNQRQIVVCTESTLKFKVEDYLIWKFLFKLFPYCDG